jgi:hypothetical protein
MRFFEFAEDLDNIDRFVVSLRNLIGRAASKKAPAQMNWAALNQISKASGDELSADYETFKSMYDSSPVIQKLVKNFDADGITLNVPGAPDDQSQAQKGAQTAQQQVDQTADTAAAGQLAQSQQTPTPPAQA